MAKAREREDRILLHPSSCPLTETQFKHFDASLTNVAGGGRPTDAVLRFAVSGEWCLVKAADLLGAADSLVRHAGIPDQPGDARHPAAGVGALAEFRICESLPMQTRTTRSSRRTPSNRILTSLKAHSTSGSPPVVVGVTTT